MISEIEVSIHDFEKLNKCYNKCYTGKNLLTQIEYVETILNFSSKALKLRIPGKIMRSLLRIQDRPMAA